MLKEYKKLGHRDYYKLSNFQSMLETEINYIMFHNNSSRKQIRDFIDVYLTSIQQISLKCSKELKDLIATSTEHATNLKKSYID